MNEIQFLQPWLFALALLATVILLLRRRLLRFSVQHPRADRFAGCGFGRPPAWLYIPRFFDWCALLLLVAALTQPVLPVGLRKTVVQALDLILCVDISASMSMKMGQQTKGPTASVSSKPSGPTRMEAVKRVALDFIKNRPQDRIGLVVFSANAYVVNPLTTDHRVLSEYISLVDTNTLIGEGLTSVGAGLQASNQVMSLFSSGQKGEGKVVIVLTDAEQNYGLKANVPLQESRQNRTKVYFIGVGVPIEHVLFDQIALVHSTGGDAFDAVDLPALQKISQQIDRLQRNPVEVTEYFRNQPVDRPLLVLASVLMALSCVLRALRVFYTTG